jgi:hypothetical protein
VQNGGFETGDFTGWSLVGNTVIGRGRRATIYDAVEISSAGYQVVHSGNYGAFLGDNAVATLSQTISTVTGQNYLLSFWVNCPVSGSVQQFAVDWNGTSLTNLNNPPAFSWNNLQFIVTATGASSILQFAVENDPSYFGLDDVSIAPIPAAAFGPAVKTPSSFSLTWNSASGLSYQLQYTTDLAQPNWINLGSPVVATGNSLTVTDGSAGSATTQRFYRLILAP